MSKTIDRLKEGIQYHTEKLNRFRKVYALIQEHPQMEEALERLLKYLEENNFI